MINKNKTLWPLWRVLRECVCVWGEESACGSHTKSVCQVLCQCCVEDAVCSSGLGTHCIHPLFRVCLCVPVRVVLHLKHGWFTQQMGVCVCLCKSVCLFTHLMDYTVKKVGELANTERLDTARMKEYTCWFLGVQAYTPEDAKGKKMNGVFWIAPVIIWTIIQQSLKCMWRCHLTSFDMMPVAWTLAYMNT